MLIKHGHVATLLKSLVASLPAAGLGETPWQTLRSFRARAWCRGALLRHICPQHLQLQLPLRLSLPQVRLQRLPRVLLLCLRALAVVRHRLHQHSHKATASALGDITTIVCGTFLLAAGLGVVLGSTFQQQS